MANAPPVTPPSEAPPPPAGTPPAADPPANSPSLAASGEAPPPAPPAGDPPPAAFALDKVKLPEGMKADNPLISEFASLMTDDKVSPADRGQKLLDLYAKGHKELAEANVAAWETLQKDWQTKTMADPEVGGAKWAVSKATIAKAIDTLGPDLAAGFREALDVTGAGNHPAIVKALHAFAAKLTEGTHISGSPPAQRPSVKEAFYPNSPDMK